LHFAPDVEATLEFATVLLNTTAAASRSGADELSTLAQLHDLLDEQRFGGVRTRSGAERHDVLSARARLRHLWTRERDDLVAGVNDILAEANANPRLVRHDELDWHIHAVPLDAPLRDRIQVEIALAFADIIRADETDRLRECEAFDCEGLLIDMSRNGSKRFCSVRCGNRMNMVAWRARQS
jgi:predicted RNA-binding Zn ribbon-like protein